MSFAAEQLLISRIFDPDDPMLDSYRHIRERDMVGRQGLFVAEGKIVLSMLVDSEDYEIESALLLESRVPANNDLVNRISKIAPVFIVTQPVIDAVAGFNVHRGILAIGRKARTHSLADIMGSEDKDRLVVVLSGISNHDNVGSIFRNAAAFGVDAVILDDLSCDPLYRKALRVSVGSVLAMPWNKGCKVDDILDLLVKQEYSIAALSPTGTHDLSELPSSGRRALLLGSEGHGLPKRILDSVATYRIPMRPGFDSLNVATASGIAIYTASGFSK